MLMELACHGSFSGSSWIALALILEDMVQWPYTAAKRKYLGISKTRSSMPGLAELFEGLDVFPYSAEASRTGSVDLRKLPGRNKVFCGMAPASVARRLPEWQSLLEGARKLSYGRRGNQADIAKKTDAKLAGRALMPMFIYLDGLVYARVMKDETKRNQKAKGMENVVGADMKDVQDSISPALRQSSATGIQEIVAQLHSGEGDLHTIAELFYSEYRDCLKVVMPESAAIGETTQGTKL